MGPSSHRAMSLEEGESPEVSLPTQRVSGEDTAKGGYLQAQRRDRPRNDPAATLILNSKRLER